MKEEAHSGGKINFTLEIKHAMSVTTAQKIVSFKWMIFQWYFNCNLNKN